MGSTAWPGAACARVIPAGADGLGGISLYADGVRAHIQGTDVMNTASSLSGSNESCWLPAGAEALPILDQAQVGHLRHIANLARQLDGDWSHMGWIETGQEAPNAYRYQLAWMAYSLAVAHFHRLPGAPGAFKDTYANLMRKMLRYDVWSYWAHTSKSGPFFDADLTELREGWMDPVVKENIMYSGHVHAMAGLFGVLFDDDRYEREGGLTFEFKPVFSSGAARFIYDLSALNEVIYWQMVESGFLGIACEPNMVFVVCNQFPMLGFRFHDLRKGTQYAEEVTRAYHAAWQRKGWVTNDDFFLFYFQKQDYTVGAENSYSATLLNAWNPEFVRALYPRQVAKGFEEPEPGMLLPRPRLVTGEFVEKFVAPDSAVGLSALWFSEMGDEERLHKLLRYVDTYQNPTWEKGGLFYPRRDEFYDEHGHFVYVDPWVGNALIAFARLNVSNGLNTLYSRPWNQAHFAEPSLAEVSPCIDVLRCGYLPDTGALVTTVQADASANGRPARLAFRNFAAGAGNWVMEREGKLLLSGQGSRITANDDSLGASVEEDLLVVTMPVDGPTDVVLWTNR